MNKRLAIGAIVAIAVGVGVAIMVSNGGGGSKAEEETSAVVEGDFDKAPAFSLQDYNGNAVTLADSAGKIRILNAWAKWCPFCVNELPDFARIQEEFGDQLVIIAINRQEPLNVAKKFTDKNNLTGTMTFLLDPTDSFYQSIGGFAMPETLFVDGSDNIHFHKRGPINYEEMKNRLIGMGIEPRNAPAVETVPVEEEEESEEPKQEKDEE